MARGKKVCVLPSRRTLAREMNPHLTNPNPALSSAVSSLPVAVIGAGPIGLAAAAQLAARGMDFVVLEAGQEVAAAMRAWSHVRLFSPWSFNVDATAAAWLAKTGWVSPEGADYPTGGELVAHYLDPLSRVPAIAERLRLGARVTGITRVGRDKMKSDAGRATAAFRLRVADAAGEETELLARAVIDASGTWSTPNPLGAEGMMARGEQALAEHIRYGIPDVLHAERARYAGKRVMVVGSGHSAFNVLVDLAKLADEAPGTRVVWVVRREKIEGTLGGGVNDALAARGALGAAVERLLAAGRLTVERGFRVQALERTLEGFVAVDGARRTVAVDELVGTTGFRPDFGFLRELQIGIDPAVESTPTLAPMIDPNLHSCGTVRPHGHRELAHPESGFYIAGMKSYGRAPTFLMLTGYEQVRSIVATMAGDAAAADAVRLVLPQTGVCTRNKPGATGGSGAACAVEPELTTVATATAEAGCCGGPPVANTSACCVADEAAKVAGEGGCGCAAEAGAAAKAPDKTANGAAPTGCCG